MDPEAPPPNWLCAKSVADGGTATVPDVDGSNNAKVLAQCTANNGQKICKISDVTVYDPSTDSCTRCTIGVDCPS